MAMCVAGRGGCG